MSGRKLQEKSATVDDKAHLMIHYLKLCKVKLSLL